MDEGLLRFALFLGIVVAVPVLVVVGVDIARRIAAAVRGVSVARDVPTKPELH